MVRWNEDPRLFSSFGPWPSMKTIAAMQAHPGIAGAVATLTVLYEKTELGTYLVAEVAGQRLLNPSHRRSQPA